MAARPLLVDSCFYIRELREGRDPLRRLTGAVLDRDLAVCGVVRCEVGRGIRDRRVHARFDAFWDVMLNVPTDNRLWMEVENLAWQLDREGIVLPLTDMVIGCCAKRIGAAVLTHDAHFESIPDLPTLDGLEL